MKSGALPGHVAGGGGGSPPSFSQKRGPWPAPLLPLIHFSPYSLRLRLSEEEDGRAMPGQGGPPCPPHTSPPGFICALLQWRPSTRAQALTGRAGQWPLDGLEVWTGARGDGLGKGPALLGVMHPRP